LNRRFDDRPHSAPQRRALARSTRVDAVNGRARRALSVERDARASRRSTRTAAREFREFRSGR